MRTSEMSNCVGAGDGLCIYRRAVTPRLSLALAAFGVVLGVAPPAASESPEPIAKLVTNAAAGYEVRETADGDEIAGPYFGFARLTGSVKHPGVGRALVRLGADNLDGRLVDAFAELAPVPWWSLRAGYYRVPSSLLFLEPLPKLRFVNRGLAERPVPKRRVGIDMGLGLWPGARLQLGLFNPRNTADPEDTAQVFAVRLKYQPIDGLTTHLSYTTLVFEDQNVDPDTGDRIWPQNDVAVAAVEWEHGGFRLMGEGLYIFDAPGGTYTVGSTVELSYKVGAKGEFQWEPAARFSHVRNDGFDTEQVTVGLNLYPAGFRIVPMVNYQVDITEVQEIHAGFLQLRGEFAIEAGVGGS